MKTTIKIAVTLLIIVGVLAVIEFTPDPQTIERIENGVRYVETVNHHGKKHGLQQIYVGDRLSAERTFEHGFVVESIEYNMDGTIKDTHEWED